MESSGPKKDVGELILALKQYIDMLNGSDSIVKEVHKCRKQYRELIKIAENLDDKLTNESK